MAIVHGGRAGVAPGHVTEARTKEKYAGLMSGMNLPPGMKLPF